MNSWHLEGALAQLDIASKEWQALSHYKYTYINGRLQEPIPYGAKFSRSIIFAFFSRMSSARLFCIYKWRQLSFDLETENEGFEFLEELNSESI